MEEKDYYSILGVSRDASDDEIKKKYRELSKKYHPDRWSSKPESERKAAEEKFKEINEANSVLSDPEKRANYDRFGTAEGGPDINDIFNRMRSGFSGFGFGGFEEPRGPKPGQSIQVNVNVSIEELFNGIDKTVDYKIMARCKDCGGEGGHGVRKCPYCHGTGMVTETKRTGFGIMQSSHPCPHCHGRGQTFTETCKKCHGTGLCEETRSIHVQFGPGVREGTTMMFRGAGYESKDKNGYAGDVMAVFTYAFDKKRYRTVGLEVYELVDVPYYDMLLGAEKTIKNPAGRNVKFTIPKCSKDGDVIHVPGMGINGHSYHVVLNAQWPKTVSAEEAELLKKIAKLHRK